MFSEGWGTGNILALAFSFAKLINLSRLAKQTPLDLVTLHIQNQLYDKKEKYI